MTSLVWDQSGSHFYELGVDRGVLYLSDGTGVPWNGLISVSESSSGSEGSPIYFDGVKYADSVYTGDYSASLKAYTYPDEFLEFEGVLEVGNGLFVTNQVQERFSLSYRSKIGNDTDDENYGYKIHILYNLTAVPQQKNYETISGDKSVMEFEWNVTGVPGEVPGFKPTVHLIFDTRRMSPLLVADIEATLYGTPITDPTLPPISTLTSFSDQWVIIRITDNFDGTWTVTAPDSYITMLDSTTFQINQANAIFLDVNTYSITDLTH